MRSMAILLSLVCVLLGIGHQARCETLPQKGKPCGDHWDGTWMAVKPKALEGPTPVRQGPRVTSKASGPKFLQARLGDWTYRVLDVVMKNGSTQGMEVYMDPNWVAALPFLKNGTLSVDNLTKVSSLYGEGAGETDAAYAYRVKRLKPASGKYMIFLRNSGKAPVWVEDVMVCARQIDFSSDGEPMTPRGVALLNSRIRDGYGRMQHDPSGNDEVLAGKQVLTQRGAKQDGQFSRWGIDCGENYGRCCGGILVGTYVPVDCGASCTTFNKHNLRCASGDVQVGAKDDCGVSTWEWDFLWIGHHAFCPPVKICGKCQRVDEFVRAELIRADYPSKATDVSEGEFTVFDTTTVENCGNTAKDVTVRFALQRNAITLRALYQKLQPGTFIDKLSLDLKIPVVGTDLQVSQGGTQSIMDRETIQAPMMETSYEVKVTIPPHVKQKVTASKKTTSAKVKVPIRYKAFFSGRPDPVEIDDVVTFDVIDLLTSGDIQLSYGDKTYC